MAKKLFLTLSLALLSPLFVMAMDDMFDELWRFPGLSEEAKGKNNDVEKFQYYGNVRSVNVYELKKTEDGKRVKGNLRCTRVFDKQKRIIEYRKGNDKYTYRYDSLGRCVEKKEFEYEKMKYQRIRCYNAQGNLLTDRNFREGKLYEERRNIYDEANRLVCSTKIYDGSLIEVLKITYDKKGNMVDSSDHIKDGDSMVLGDYTRKEYDSEGKLLNKEHSHLGWIIREIYSYEAGQLKEMVRKLIDGYRSHCLTFHYGKDGRLFSMDSTYCSNQGICGEIVVTAYYDSLGRRVSERFLRLGLVDSTVYDAKGRVVKMFQDYDPQTGHAGSVTNILYDQNGNEVERHTQRSDTEWEKWIKKYKNGYQIEYIQYVGKGKKYRKRTSTKDMTVGMEDSDATWKETIPVYEYVDKPWAEYRIVNKYDKWGNKTYVAVYDEGELTIHSVATYQGRNRPLTCVSYYKGEVTSSSVYKTDSHGNMLEEYVHDANGTDSGMISEFEYYDE